MIVARSQSSGIGCFVGVKSGPIKLGKLKLLLFPALSEAKKKKPTVSHRAFGNGVPNKQWSFHPPRENRAVFLTRDAACFTLPVCRAVA